MTEATPSGALGPSGTSGPLAGLLVADFSRVLAGPYATMLLADLGAEVIKVEGPRGDDTRGWQPPTHDGVATYYLGVNRNKRSVVLDFQDPTDATLARELAHRADIMIENFRPGSLARWALDYDSVKITNPGLIYASISGFGATEKGAALPGYDLLVQAASGLMSVTGEPDGPPYKSGVAVVDVTAGLHTVIGVIAALHHRAQTGEGQHVEVNLLTSALSGLVNQTSAYVAGGVTPFRMGNIHPSLCPYEPLPCADGEVIIAVGNDDQFRRFAQALGAAELADDPRYARNADRVVNRAELRPLLEAALRPFARQELIPLLTAARVPCGPINSIAEGVSYAADLGLEPIVELGPTDAPVRSVRHPITFSVTPPSYRLPPPRLGEHGAEIRAWLGERSS